MFNTTLVILNIFPAVVEDLTSDVFLGAAAQALKY